MAPISYALAIRRLADEAPDRTAAVCDDDSITFRDLDRRSSRLARAYAALGAGEGDLVTIALPNGIEFLLACLAAWKLGAVPNPVSPRLPKPERDAILERARPSLIAGAEPGSSSAFPGLPAGYEPGPALSDAPLPDRVSPHERAIASGGSTGRPKLILAMSRPLYDPETASPLFEARRAALVPGPLYHAAPLSAAWQALLGGARVVVMRRFDASLCLELIERHRVDRVSFVPTMMLRIFRLPEEERLRRDLSSLEFVMTGGAPCPPWLFRAWIDWLGPEVMHEAYGPSERIGGTFITGKEWLAHPGSVGRPTRATKIRIVDPETQRELPAGEMGEIYMMPAGGQGSTYRYIGAQARAAADGWESVGDMGYLDADGYLYLGDRRADMILSGGRNVYPAEVEAAIEEHPAVRSSAVIGLPHDDLGQAVHAIVETVLPVGDDELRAHLGERIVHYKIPRSFECVDRPLRDEAGKVRRSALREARIGRRD